MNEDFPPAELRSLCARAADALEEEFGSPILPAYGVRGPVHDLIAELRKASTIPSEPFLATPDEPAARILGSLCHAPCLILARFYLV